jgi:hypothetical protein
MVVTVADMIIPTAIATVTTAAMTMVLATVTVAAITITVRESMATTMVGAGTIPTGIVDQAHLIATVATITKVVVTTTSISQQPQGLRKTSSAMAGDVF